METKQLHAFGPQIDIPKTSDNSFSLKDTHISERGDYYIIFLYVETKEKIQLKEFCAKVFCIININHRGHSVDNYSLLDYAAAYNPELSRSVTRKEESSIYKIAIPIVLKNPIVTLDIITLINVISMKIQSHIIYEQEKVFNVIRQYDRCTFRVDDSRGLDLWNGMDNIYVMVVVSKPLYNCKIESTDLCYHQSMNVIYEDDNNIVYNIDVTNYKLCNKLNILCKTSEPILIQVFYVSRLNDIKEPKDMRGPRSEMHAEFIRRKALEYKRKHPDPPPPPNYNNYYAVASLAIPLLCYFYTSLRKTVEYFHRPRT